MHSKTNWNTVILLSLTQALFQTSTILVSTLSAVVGLALATDKSLATLPIAVISVATAAMIIPASLFIRKFGQRTGFLVGTILGMLAGLIAWYGVIEHSFSIFVLGNLFIGFYQGFAQYYRFAAADSVPEASKGRAISFVLTGGVIAAIAGPNLARFTQDMGSTPFVYSYLSITALSIVSFIIIFMLKLQRPSRETTVAHEQARPLVDIISQKTIATALISSIVGYSVMVIVMTATPLAMQAHGHTHDDSAMVIQWHVLGMFVPSFFTGSLIDRFGARNVILCGILILGVHVTFALTGTDFLHFVSGLIFLGIGWNFMFIGGTALLSKTYRPSEKEKTQAFHDFVVFGMISLSSFSAGGILNYSGWLAVNLAVIPLLLIAFITILISKRNYRLSLAAVENRTDSDIK
jgi:predicted MFS family arabinose efflux permease